MSERTNDGLAATMPMLEKNKRPTAVEVSIP